MGPKDGTAGTSTGGAPSAGMSSGGGTWKGGPDLFRLPQIGPVELPTLMSPDGYTYRNNVVYPTNRDRVEMIQSFRAVNLSGTWRCTSSVQVASSAYHHIDTYLDPYIYTMLHEMAQMRDGYRSQDVALTDPLNVNYRDNLIVSLKINLRVLWALYHCMMYNEATKALIPGLSNKRRQLAELLEWSNKLIYPSALDALIDYWSAVFVPYPGGPVCYSIFDLFFPWSSVIAPAVGAFTATYTLGAPPNLATSAGAQKVIDDCRLALTMVDQYNLAVATDATDFRLITSLYKMMGFPSPQTGVKGLSVSLKHWVDQFMANAFYFVDTKGAGTDTFVCDPDIMGSMDILIELIDLQVPPDDLDWIGGKGAYAFDLQDSSTEGYCAMTEKVLSLGCVLDMSGSAIFPRHVWKIFTQEDGFSYPSSSADMTEVGDVQGFLWSLPLVTLHPQSWTAIRSEESEENYRTGLSARGPATVQMPAGHHGDRFLR